MRKLIAVVVVSAGMAAMGEVHEPLTNGLSCHVVTKVTCGDCPRFWWPGFLGKHPNGVDVFGREMT